ncbi:MAG: agmatine deiminase family protein, partial [Bdellovibrionales bacterium]|nr:agmatine deiminase family protein [Bdellovibrionales bacterium]
ALGFHQSAEREPHEAVWLAWPSHSELWGEGLKRTQREFKALCQAIADLDPQTGIAHGEDLWVLVGNENSAQEARVALEGLPVRFFQIPFGDIWLRDTAPIFMRHREKGRAAVCFDFNGWGKKYVLPHDADVAQNIADTMGSGVEQFKIPWILEGGSVEVDGEGTCLTTRQCLLHPLRNEGWSQEQLEVGLKAALGVKKVLWLNKGLKNDHTDGHIDTLVRFSRPGVVLCMQASSDKDPNTKVFSEIKMDLEKMKDAKERPLRVIEIPSPGPIYNEEGDIMPASYLNFYIANTQVVVPTYGSEYDEEAVHLIGKCFPGHRTVGLSAKAILEGGGAFHCITQQVPIE